MAPGSHHPYQAPPVLCVVGSPVASPRQQRAGANTVSMATPAKMAAATTTSTSTKPPVRGSFRMDLPPASSPSLFPAPQHPHQYRGEGEEEGTEGMETETTNTRVQVEVTYEEIGAGPTTATAHYPLTHNTYTCYPATQAQKHPQHYSAPSSQHQYYGGKNNTSSPSPPCFASGHNVTEYPRPAAAVAATGTQMWRPVDF